VVGQSARPGIPGLIACRLPGSVWAMGRERHGLGVKVWGWESYCRVCGGIVGTVGLGG